MVVPFAPGGPSDVIGRIFAERMRVSLGQPIIIENVTGAGGSIGTGRVARAAGDGYTLVLGFWGTHVANGALYTLPYDLLNDFEPISLLVSNPSLILAKKAMPANDLKDLIAWLKANPDKASAGNGGVGTPPHVVAAFFQKVTGTRFQLVPYRGAGPALQDLVAGQTDLQFDYPVTSLPHVRAGAIKAYAVTAKSRLTAAPDIPTVDEAGLPEFLLFDLVCAVVVQRHAERCHRQAQCCCQGSDGRPGGEGSPGRSWRGNSAARSTNSRGPRRASKSRNREVVADNQGGRDQGPVTV